MKVDEAHGEGEAVPLPDMADEGVDREVAVKLEVEVTLYPDVRVGTGLAQGEGLVEALPDKEGLVVAVLEKGIVPDGKSLGEADSVRTGLLETLEVTVVLGKPDKEKSKTVGVEIWLAEDSALKSYVVVVVADAVTHAEALEDVVDDTVLVAKDEALDVPGGVTVLLALCVGVTVAAMVPVIVGVEVLQGVDDSDIAAVAVPTTEGELLAVAKSVSDDVWLLEKEDVVVTDEEELRL